METLAISGTGFDASASGTGAGGAFNGPGNTDQTTKRSARGSVCQIKQQRTQLEAQSAQIETLQSDLAKKEGSDLPSQALVQSGNVLQQVQQKP